MPFSFTACFGGSRGAPKSKKCAFPPKSEGESVEEWISRIEKFVNDVHETIQEEKVENAKQIGLLQAELEEEKKATLELEEARLNLEEKSCILKEKVESVNNSVGNALNRIRNLESEVLDEDFLSKMADIRSEFNKLKDELVCAQESVDENYFGLAKVRDVNAVKAHCDKEVVVLRQKSEILKKKIEDGMANLVAEEKRGQQAANRRMSQVQEQSSAHGRKVSQEVLALWKQLAEVNRKLDRAKESVQNDINILRKRIYARPC